MADGPDITALLLAWRDTGEAARNRLIEVLYEKLHGIARRHLSRERPDHSLTPTALVHEAYLRLVDQRRVTWRSRKHFFAIAAHVMRRVLVDYARAQAAAKRNRAANVAFNEADIGTPAIDIDVLALDEALEKLARVDPRRSRLVELRFFAGLSIEETAAALEVAPITIKRDWALARAWLFRELQHTMP